MACKNLGLSRPGSTPIEIKSLTHPLDSDNLAEAFEIIEQKNGVIVLIFDQFEELFAKEALFDTFTAIRELSLDLDSKQVPLILGFAWKTDISLPQQHPAYHLWHELADRRRDFKIPQFGSGDISKVISRAEREIKTKFSSPLRARLIEQCQGYPWLLKKILVHVSKRLNEATSQYALLERELDVEVLFKEDLADLNSEQSKCLKFIAEHAPINVTDVEENFSSDCTRFLLARRLLIRSGLNYVIYWDIFRDYLTEGRIPQIPWARTFQLDPSAAVIAANKISQNVKISARDLAELMGLKIRTCLNLLSDLIALQLIDKTVDDNYTLANHIQSVTTISLAEHVHKQLSRH